MEKKMADICELKNHLISFAQQNQEMSDIPMYGQVIDMIKDLYEAEKDCWKACYYKEMVEMMKKEKENPEMQRRFGYDNWRYSSGQFAPKGHGHYAGYPMIPMDMMYGMEPEWMNGMPMTGPFGYSGGSGSGDGQGGRGGNSGGSSGGGRGGSSSGRGGSSGGRYGYPMEDWMGQQNPYEMYQESRRYYHESKNPEAKMEMEQHAKEHVEETMDSIRDIWEESTPELRREMKKNLTNLVNNLPA